MTTATTSPTETHRARQQARLQYESIVELMEAYENAHGEKQEDAAREAIENDPLLVAVRGDWHCVHEQSEDVEYMILLCTGGPVVRIIGELGAHNRPQTAVLEHQDWFTPWTAYDGDYDQQVLLSYATMFLES